MASRLDNIASGDTLTLNVALDAFIVPGDYTVTGATRRNLYVANGEGRIGIVSRAAIRNIRHLINGR